VHHHHGALEEKTAPEAKMNIISHKHGMAFTKLPEKVHPIEAAKQWLLLARPEMTDQRRQTLKS
jgi:hypothetical protein